MKNGKNKVESVVSRRTIQVSLADHEWRRFKTLCSAAGSSISAITKDLVLNWTNDPQVLKDLERFLRQKEAS